MKNTKQRSPEKIGATTRNGGRRPRRPAAETRLDILNTAERLFCDRGYQQVTMADIAMTLHMSPANVFKHFHSKIDLVDAIISSHLEKKLQAISHINLTCSPQKKLFQVAEILLINFREDVAKNPHLFEMVIFIANMELKAITLYRDGLIAIIKSVIDEGVDKGDFFVRDTHHAAQTALCALEGVFNPITIAREKPDTLLARCHDIVDLIITALQNPLAK